MGFASRKRPADRLNLEPFLSGYFTASDEYWRFRDMP